MVLAKCSFPTASDLPNVRAMKRHLVLVAAMISGSVGLAQAAPRATYRWTDPSAVGKAWQAPNPEVVSHVIFMNR